MANARLEKQIGIVAADRVGLLNEVTSALSEAGVNIVTVSAWAMEGSATFLMVTSDSAKAAEVLKGKGFGVRESEVVLIDLENKMGAAAELTKKLADAGINMSYLYGTTGAPDAPALLVLNSDNNSKAVEVLNA